MFFILLLSACSQVKETPGGLKFEIVKAGDGILAKKDQVVLFNYRLVDSNDSVWIDTYAKGHPVIDVIRDTAFVSKEKGLKQMLRMVSSGDSIHVNYSVPDYYRDVVKKPMPLDVDSTLSLVYYISIDSIMPKDEYRKWNYARRTRLREKQMQTDIEIIDNYLFEKKINTEKSHTGIRYVITRQGKGENAYSGQLVKVNYSGYLLDGRCFATNIKSVAQAIGIYDSLQKYEPIEVYVDQSLVIAAWHDALKKLNKGAKGTFYIPSPLAYGQQKQSELIKENEILVFEIEMIDVK